MNWDVGIPLLMVVATVLISGIGVEMANNAPTSAKSRNVYRIIFAGLGLSLGGLTYWQAERGSAQQIAAKVEAANAAVKSALDIGSVRGQLTNMQQMMIDAMKVFQKQSNDPHLRDLAVSYALLAQSVTASANTPSPQDPLRKKVTDLIADLRASDLHDKFSAIPQDQEHGPERRAIGQQFHNTFNGRCYEIAAEMEKRNMKSEGQILRMTCGGAISGFGQDRIADVIGQLQQFASTLP